MKHRGAERRVQTGAGKCSGSAMVFLLLNVPDSSETKAEN